MPCPSDILIEEGTQRNKSYKHELVQRCAWANCTNWHGEPPVRTCLRNGGHWWYDDIRNGRLRKSPRIIRPDLMLEPRTSPRLLSFVSHRVQMIELDYILDRMSSLCNHNLCFRLLVPFLPTLSLLPARRMDSLLNPSDHSHQSCESNDSAHESRADS